MFTLGARLNKFTAKLALVALATTASLSVQLIDTTPANAAEQITTTVTPSSVTAGGKLNLVTTMPQVSSSNSAMQEVIQTIDPTKVNLTSASDVIAPAGWIVSFSQDGITWLSTPTDWSAVTKVKATGPLNSGGLTQNGNQIVSRSVPITEATATLNSAAGSGDGWDVAIDSRGYLFNTYHHSTPAAIDCRLKSTGARCSSNWAFSLATYGFATADNSTQFIDDVYHHLWIANGKADGAGFLCIDVNDISTPKLCGGSLSTAWKVVKVGAAAYNSTQHTAVTAANGMLFGWDSAADRLTCLNYLANSGLGAPCSASLPLTPRVTASTTYPRILVHDGLVYVMNGITAVCVDSRTLGLCPGWASGDYKFASAQHTVYKLPNVDGEIVAVCYAPGAKCFTTSGDDYPANQLLNNRMIFHTYRHDNDLAYANNPVTQGTRVLFADFYTLHHLWCFDVSNTSTEVNAAGNCSGFTPSGNLSYKTITSIYTATQDPQNPNCLWTNGDNGVITPVEISTGATGCAMPPTRVTFSGEMIVPRMTCDASSGIIQWKDFVMSGVTKGVDYSSATLTVLNDQGLPVVSNGKTWAKLQFDSSNTVDISGMTSDSVGDKPTFVIDFVGRGTSTAPIGKISVVSAPAQLCLSLTAKVNLPTGYIYQAGASQTAAFSAIGSTTIGSNPAINYAQANATATIGAPTPEQFGSPLSGTVTNGLTGSSLRAIPGAVATLLDAAGNVLTGPNSLPITATADAQGAFNFGYVLPGTYKLSFSDLASGAGDVRTITVAAGTAATATVNFATQASLTSNAFTVGLGTNVPVTVVYHLPSGAVNDAMNVGFNAGSGNVTSLNVLANDTPTTTAAWNLASIKILNTAVTPNVYVAPTTLATGLPAVLNGVTVGTYYVNTTTGAIVFAPTTGYTGPVPPIGYSITDNYAGTGGARTAYAAVTPTVLAGPTVGADTMLGDFSELPNVNVLANDSAAAGATIDASTFKLCPLVGSKTVASITATGSGTLQTYTSAAAHGLFNGQYVTVSGLTGTDAAAFNVVRAVITVTSPTTFTIAGPGITANISGTASITAITPADCSLTSVLVATKGTYTSAADGTVTFTPVAGWSGTVDPITYMVKDSLGAPTFGTVQATVLAVPPVINTTTLTSGQVNVAYSLTLSGTAGSAAMKASPWLVTGLPAGLTYNATTGVISGTPTVTGTFPVSVTYTATDNRRAIQTFSLTIGQPPVITDQNTGANAFTIAEPCVLNLPCTYSPGVSQGTAVIPSTGAWTITAGGANLTNSGLNFSADTGVISGTVSVADFSGLGYFNLTVKVTDANGLSDTHTIRLVFHTPPVITTAPVDGTVGVALAQNQTYTRGFSNGLYFLDPPTNGTPWSVSGLPNGLTIDRTTGVMSGIPTVAGTFPITITLIDDHGDISTRTVDWVIKARPSVATSALGNVAIGVNITPINLQATLGTAPALKATAAWTATGLPAGLTLNATTGVITGVTNVVAGSYPIDITVTDSASLTSVVKTLNLNVVAPSVITTATPVQLVSGVTMMPIQETYTLSPSATLPVSGAWSVSGLPAGLSFNTSTGTISGTPLTGGAYNVVVSMTDSLGVKVSKTLRLNIVDAPDIMTASKLPPLVSGTPMGTAPNAALTIDVAPGTANLSTYALADGTTLPAGLSLNASTGAITGTPTLPAGSTGVSTTFKIKVTDANGLSDTESFTVWVGVAPTWLSTTIPDAITDTVTGRIAGANITLVQGVAMTPYNQADPLNLDVSPDAAVTGGTFAISSGALPAGLTVNPTTGVISGTPTGAAATNFAFGVKFTDANGLVSPEKAYVVNLVAPPVITTVDPPVWKKDVAITSFAQVKTNGTSTAAAATNPWTISPALPAGLVFNQTTGAITGTPTVAVDADFTVTYTDSYGLVATKVEHIVVAVPPTITTLGTAAASAATIPAGSVNSSIATVNETIVRGTGTVPATNAWTLKAASTLPAGLWMNPNTGAIMGTPQTAGTYSFTVVLTDSYGLTAEKVFNFTVYNPPTVTTASFPYVEVGVTLPTLSTGTPNSTNFKLAAAAGVGALIPTAIVAPNTSVWAASGLPAGITIDATTGQLSGTSTIAGIYPVTFTVTDNHGITASKTINFSVVSGPTITSGGAIVAPATSALLANVGRSMPQTDLKLEATPGTYPLATSSVWSITAGTLPTGLTLNATTGAITGTTSVAAADFPITVRVVDQLGLARTKNLIIKVRDLPVVTSALEAIAAEDQPFSYPQTATVVAPATIPATGAWSATGLPEGLSINPNTGLISGTPTTPGVYTVKVSVVDSAGLTGSLVETIEVGQAPSITTPRMLPVGRTGVLYSVDQIFDEGTSGAIPDTGAWSIASGSLPAGLTLDPDTGEIAGTPTALGTSTFTLKLTNENGFFDTEVFSVSVLAPGANLTIFNLPADVLDGFPVTPLPIDLAPLASSAANLPISYGTDTPAVCFTDSEGKLTVVAAGVCKVWASSGTGVLASKITQTFTATKSGQTISVPTDGLTLVGEKIQVTDDPRGLQLPVNVSSGLDPIYTVTIPLTGEAACDVDDNGVVTWTADIVTQPVPPANLVCDVTITQPGDAGFNAAQPKLIKLTARHVDVELPAGYVQTDKPVTTGLPRTGGTVMKGAVGFVVTVDAKKKTIAVKALSKGVHIGPIMADITVKYKKGGVEATQVCKQIKFGDFAKSEKPADIAAAIKKYKAMPKYKTGNKPGYFDMKKFSSTVSCVMNKDAWAWYAAGNSVKAVATVVRDRRWPTTYLKKYPNGQVITPTKVIWNLAVG